MAVLLKKSGGKLPHSKKRPPPSYERCMQKAGATKKRN